MYGGGWVTFWSLWKNTMTKDSLPKEEVWRGLEFQRGETWKQAAGWGSGSIPEAEGAHQKQSLPPEHTQQGHITSANSVTSWGSNAQRRACGDTIIRTARGEDTIILTNIIHFTLIDVAPASLLHSCSLTKVWLRSRHNGKL